jgi:hypothetical protein
MRFNPSATWARTPGGGRRSVAVMRTLSRMRPSPRQSGGMVTVAVTASSPLRSMSRNSCMRDGGPAKDAGT